MEKYPLAEATAKYVQVANPKFLGVLGNYH